jgi:hypothetical protein
VARHVMVHSHSVSPRITLHTRSHFLNISGYLMSEDRRSYPHAMQLLQVGPADPANLHLHEQFSSSNPRSVNIGELKSASRINECGFQGAAKPHL